MLVIDVGGTHVKILATGQTEHRSLLSGPTLTAKQMVSGVKRLAKGWKYHVVSIGYPGPVLRNRPVAEPHNLASGWVAFDYEEAFGCPVKMVNDAAMQALGSYKSGKLLFLGLGTGLGSTMVADGIVEPMELGHLPYKNATYEDYVGLRGLEKHGKKKWRLYVEDLCGPPDHRHRARRRRSWRRQRQETKRSAQGLSGRRQRQCISWGISFVGGAR